jgi:heme/copper-type cytochrome/quinol oxidase subunit 2
MTEHISTDSSPETPRQEEKKWRRTHTLCLVLFVIWVAVAVAMFLYIHENKDKKDEDGNYVIWPVPAKEE